MSTAPPNQEKQVRQTMKTLLPGFWIYIVFSGIVSLVIQLAGLIPTILMQRIIDRLIPEQNLSKILLYIALFVCIPLMITVLSAFYRYQLTMVGRRLGMKLAVKGFENLMGQPVSFFDREKSSELANYCRKESMNYIVFWLIDIPQLAATGLCGVVVFGYLCSLNWWVALFLLLYIPVAFFPSNRFANKVKGFFGSITENNGKMMQIINDTFRGIKTIKSMVLEKVQVQKLMAVNEKNMSVWSKIALYDNLTGIWVDNFSDSVFTGVTFGLAAYLIVLGKMTLGSLVVVLNYTARFLGIAKKFMHTNYNFKAQLGEYQKLFEILTLPVDEAAGTAAFRFQEEIRFDGVTFAYTEERGNILKSLDLTVKNGEWLGIIGASGAGKTTIFDLLLRFYAPQQGTVTIDGADLQTIAPEQLRTKIAKVSQETFLFPGSIRENLLLANPSAADKELWDVLQSVGLERFVRNLQDGLDTDIGEDGALFSGGERQRLGLAQGLLRNCRVILLDEVTANVDPNSEREIKEVLTRLKREKNLTVIAISHRIGFLQDTDRIVVLENGKIREATTYAAYTKSCTEPVS